MCAKIRHGMGRNGRIRNPMVLLKCTVPLASTSGTYASRKTKRSSENHQYSCFYGRYIRDMFFKLTDNRIETFGQIVPKFVHFPTEYPIGQPKTGTTMQFARTSYKHPWTNKTNTGLLLYFFRRCLSICQSSRAGTPQTRPICVSDVLRCWHTVAISSQILFSAVFSSWQEI